MDKNAIKKYAIWARKELIAKISQKAATYGIEKDNMIDANVDSIDGVMLSSVEKKQRKALIEQINEKGYEQVIEEVAYTWFNRFTAIRFMEVNGYLPSHIRVFTDDDNNFKPQILTEAIHLNDVFEKINMERVLEFKQEDKTEELYKYLLIIQCNALNAVLPRMFQKIEDYSELLLPDYLLRDGSVLEQLVTLIPEEDWKDQVQIIGWLYQYYNSEPKDAVFAALKKNIKISKENIPAATQLFTPDWIVRYMVENSLGRLWLEGHPNDELKSEWKYYLDEAEQEEEVQKQLDEIRKEYSQLKPEDIKCIDPCMGSGHILCYMFDVLIKIYEDYGYTARDAASSIVEKNLWGLDIDERAAQLSYFAVMMKARQYDRRFLTKDIQPNVYAIEESNGISQTNLLDIKNNLSRDENDKAFKQLVRMLEEMYDAKEYGSIISVTPCDWKLLKRFSSIKDDIDSQLVIDFSGEKELFEKLKHLICIGEILSQKYHAVITNPPYMGAIGMGNKLNDYLKRCYVDSKSDLSTVFMERSLNMSNINGYIAMINIPVWMFLTSYEKLRVKLIDYSTFINMVHPGRGIFGSDFGSTSFVLKKGAVNRYCGNYRRLFDSQVEVKSPEQREIQFLESKGAYITTQDNYKKIPGNPIAYWISEAMLKVFSSKISIGDIADARKGLVTGNDNVYLKLWPEVASNNFSIFSGFENTKWKPCNKGGNFRKWYGNNDYVVNWGIDGTDLSNHRWEDGRQRSSLRNSSYFFKEGITWTYITSGRRCFRYYGSGYAFSGAGPGLFVHDSKYLWYLLAYTNSKVFDSLLKIAGASTISLESGELERAPIYLNDENIELITELTKENISISKEEWDSYEWSWDFNKHPLIPSDSNHSVDVLISDIYDSWDLLCNERYEKLKKNEERINELFISIYGMSNDIDPYVDDKDVSIRKADLQREIKSLLSYAVGCMFGRYSLDSNGLIYAGGIWDKTRYNSFVPDNDAIIPICDDEYFSDDIVGRLIEFIKTVYGERYLEKNLQFIADALGGKGVAREVIRNYFINEFYKDHLKNYQKRPIYWMFDSGKKNGFKCLVYMHRYSSDTIARIRTDYVHEQQARYRTAIADVERLIANVSTSEKVKLNKKLIILKEKDEELRIYEERIHHFADQMIEIDLDDGVKVNYAKFQELLAKIK